MCIPCIALFLPAQTASTARAGAAGKSSSLRAGESLRADEKNRKGPTWRRPENPKQLVSECQPRINKQWFIN